MKQESFEAEAATLDEARTQAKGRIPDGFNLVSEEIVSEGRPLNITVIAETSESAIAQAQVKIPHDCTVTEKKVTAPETRVIRVTAETDSEARGKVQGQLDNATIIKKVTISSPGRKGFLGIGRIPSSYDVEVLKQARADLTYRPKARIKVTISDFLTGLAPAERSAVSNLNPLLYQAVIMEKKGENAPTIITDDSHTFELIHRLDASEITQLADSVQSSIQGDDAIARNDLAKATQHYQRAFELNPYNDIALMSYGVCLARRGQLREGIRWVEKAVAADSSNERARRSLEMMKADLSSH